MEVESEVKNINNENNELEIETTADKGDSSQVEKDSETAPAKGDSSDVNKDPDEGESSSNNSFKRPLLIIGPRKGPKIIKKVEEPAPVKKSAIPALQLYGEPKQPDKPPPPLPYTEPEWGGEPPDDDFSFEVLKSGVIIETVPLNTKSFYTFGRLSNCDIQMNHPSSSRYHAVLQYRPVAAGEDNPRGFYIYDLGSTHGTFLNKQKLKPKMFAPVKVGHVITIGGSSRLLILQGPDELAEPESDLTVTELKRQRFEQQLKAKLEAEAKEKEMQEAEELRKKKEEEAGIDWGIGEDADEETDLTENPYASTNNEELYLTDPKKSLRGWFEREGQELNYDVTEKTQGQYLCKVILPVDDQLGRPLVAEALVRGKKKEAVIQCAMEACRVLDRHGLFRQATHEARGQKKKRNWAEDDYYDSDDDNFLDRTGSVEAKRQKRMAAAGKTESKADTYESLLEKLEEVRKKIQDTEDEVQKMQAARERQESQDQEEDQDALDAYMNSLKSAKDTKDKVALRAVKAELLKLKQLENRYLQLANIARPASLPPLVPAPFSGGQAKKLRAFTGARPISKPKPVASTSCTVTSQSNSDAVEEESDSDSEESRVQEESHKTQQRVQESTTEQVDKEANESRVPVEIPEREIKPEKPTSDVLAKKPSGPKLGPSIPADFLKQLQEGPSASSKQKTRTRTRQKGPVTKPVYDPEDDVSTWVPPEGQSGDGRTKLNDKFGY